jgi:DNA-binding GntR family transcriptional regulator
MKRYPALTPSLDQVVHDQRALLEALLRSDGEAAEKIARNHVIKFEAAVRALL